MQQRFEFCTINVVEFVSRDDFHVSQEIGWVILCARYAGFDLASSDTDFMDQIPVLHDKRQRRCAPQNIDRTALDVVDICCVGK